VGDPLEFPSREVLHATTGEESGEFGGSRAIRILQPQFQAHPNFYAL